MRITVLMGGTSAERDVSLASGLRVAAALRLGGHAVTAIDTVRGRLDEQQERALLATRVLRDLPPTQDALAQMSVRSLPALTTLLPSREATDLIFLGLHGGQGEDGTIQALLDLAGLPYTGSGHLSSALAMDKDLSKRLFRDAGVLTPDWMMVRRREQAVWRTAAFGTNAVSVLQLPLIVKPSKQGSTVGLTLVKTLHALGPAIDEAFRYDDEVMLEAFVPGREMTVGILGAHALPVGEIIPRHEIYDYECKYTPGMAEEVFPAHLPEEQQAKIQEMALRAFMALKLSGCARIDFRMTEDGTFYCLEANTLPGLTELSLVPQAARAAGMEFGDLCERIVRLAVRPSVSGETR